MNADETLITRLRQLVSYNEFPLADASQPWHIPNCGELRAIADRLEALSKWRWIESAPKDGTEVLGCFRTRGNPLDWRFDLFCWVKSSKEQLADAGDGLFRKEVIDTSEWMGNTYQVAQPSHWMPIFPPPTEAQESTK